MKTMSFYASVVSVGRLGITTEHDSLSLVKRWQADSVHIYSVLTIGAVAEFPESEELMASSEAMVNIQEWMICLCSSFGRDGRNAGKAVTQVHGET